MYTRGRQSKALRKRFYIVDYHHIIEYLQKEECLFFSLCILKFCIQGSKCLPTWG